MPDPVQVEGKKFSSVVVGQWILGGQLLHEAAIPGALVNSHEAVKRPAGAATQSKAYGLVASVGGLAEKSCEVDYGASARGSLAVFSFS